MRAGDLTEGQHVVLNGQEFIVTDVRHRVPFGYRSDRCVVRSIMCDAESEIGTPEQEELL